MRRPTRFDSGIRRRYTPAPVTQTTDRKDAKQRIRVGLTGLAAVLVLVLLAAAVFGLRSAESDRSARGLAHGSRAEVTGNQSEAAKDPLAELGVTPGGSGDPAPSAERTPAPSPIAVRPRPAH